MLAKKDMARGAEPSEQGLTSSIGERCPSSQIHFRQGRGGAREFRRGAGSAHEHFFLAGLTHPLH